MWRVFIQLVIQRGADSAQEAAGGLAKKAAPRFSPPPTPSSAVVAQPPGAMAPLGRRVSRASPEHGARPDLWLPAQGSSPLLEGALSTGHKWAIWKREQKPQAIGSVGIEKMSQTGKAESRAKGMACSYIKKWGSCV